MLRRALALTVPVLTIASGGCGNILGLDGLRYDEEGEASTTVSSTGTAGAAHGGGAGGTAATSGGSGGSGGVGGGSAVGGRSCTSPANTDIGATADTFLAEGSTLKHGAEEHLTLKGAAGLPVDVPARVALIAFDTSSVPQGAVICSARLALVATFGAQGQEWFVHRVLEAWDEDDADWQISVGTQSWNTPGCGRNSCEPDTIAAPELNDGLNTVTIPVETIQEWIDQPGSNHGLALKTSDEQIKFASSNAPTNEDRPQLVIEYGDR